MATYEIWISDPLGRRIKLIEKYSKIIATRIANNVGSISLTLSDLYDDYIRLDNVIEVWRKPKDGALSLFNAYLMRGWSYEDTANGDVTSIVGVDGKDLLNRRIVAYAAGSTSTSMTGTADDLMRIVVSENCGTAATDTDRDWSASGFTIAASESAAQSITMGFSYRNVLRVCQDMADASRQAGTRVYFDVFPTFTATQLISWEFSTNIDQPGIDHTGIDQVLFGPEWGNMDGAVITYDYSQEATVVYAGGSGTESSRIVEEVEDTTRTDASPWARIERFYNCSGQASDTASVYNAGQAELIAARPITRVSGTLKDGPSCRFGLDWGFGDRVVVTYRGMQFNAVVTAVQLSLYENGDEIIDGRFEIV